jgi:hypothetical protein
MLAKMTKKKWWQIPIPDKEPNLRDKKTEYYVIDKTNNRVHRMVAEDEYDLTPSKLNKYKK